MSSISTFYSGALHASLQEVQLHSFLMGYNVCNNTGHSGLFHCVNNISFLKGMVEMCGGV